MLSLQPAPESRTPGQRLVQVIVPQLSVVRAFARGVGGGLIATVLMTLYRFPLFRAIPPTSEFWAMFLGGGEPEEFPLVGLLLHFGYGGVAGGLFGVGFSRLNFRNVRNQRLGAISLSLGYGLILSIFGSRVLLHRLLDEELEPDDAVVFHIAHVVYGLTLGTWLSPIEPTGELYE